MDELFNRQENWISESLLLLLKEKVRSKIFTGAVHLKEVLRTSVVAARGCCCSKQTKFLLVVRRQNSDDGENMSK